MSVVQHEVYEASWPNRQRGNELPELTRHSWAPRRTTPPTNKSERKLFVSFSLSLYSGVKRMSGVSLSSFLVLTSEAMYAPPRRLRIRSKEGEK